ncbi:tetratricopeptide repeat protein [Aestuariibacter halophilus]|uniref:Tetratricopeptide repeat protein n=1 Tax=Fluctibacter halophilus TaxID=226011 RepID=A0ABS8GBA6_9ALTE|nr:tetratricopeptide repeat protein [Aestuariibacter halophilus]MCC2616501.1 tetratricopeptide repeat protein [Aestuariibacter halophilus]
MKTTIVTTRLHRWCLQGLMLLTMALPAAAQQSYDREQQQAISQAFVDAVNARDLDAVGQLMNMQALGQRIVDEAFTDPEIREGYMEGFGSEQARSQMIGGAMMAMQQGAMQAHFRGFVEAEGESRPLVRLDIENGGFEYMFFDFEAPTRDVDGDIADFYIASSGKWQSEQMLQATRLMLPDQNNWLKRLAGETAIDEELVKSFGQLVEHRMQGDFKAAYELLTGLPESVRHERVIIDLALQIGKLYRDDAYVFQLGELAKYHGDDPSTHFMLLDYYYLQGDVQQAMNITDKLIERFGADGPLMMIKANLYIAAGEPDNAEQSLQRAIDNEPAFLQSYWVLIQLLLQQQRFDDVVLALKGVQGQGIALSKDMFHANPEYEGFVASEAFANWTL